MIFSYRSLINNETWQDRDLTMPPLAPNPEAEVDNGGGDHLDEPMDLDEIGSDLDDELDALMDSAPTLERADEVMPDESQGDPGLVAMAMEVHAVDPELKEAMSPAPSSPKGVEMESPVKCVVIDDTPEKTFADLGDINKQIRELQFSLANARREQLALIFKFIIVRFLHMCLFFWAKQKG